MLSPAFYVLNGSLKFYMRFYFPAKEAYVSFSLLCDAVIKHMYLVFVHCFWHTAPVISYIKAMGYFFVINLVLFLKQLQSNKDEMDVFCYLYYNANPFQHTQVYVNLVIFGKHLYPLRMGASCQPVNFQTSLDLWGGERSWRLNQPPVINDSIRHAFVMKPSQKFQKSGVRRASRLVNM